MSDLNAMYDEAEKLLISVIDELDYCVDAHDLLAKVYLGKNKVDQAQNVLAQALKISPHSVGRQRELGLVSQDAEDYHASTNAFRAAIKYARNSCHEWLFHRSHPEGA